MRLAVVTTVAGRHEHLRRQHESLARGERLPDLVVVVSMGDAGVAGVVEDGPLADRAHVVPVPPAATAGRGSRSDGHSSRPLPLAAARNAGVAQAWAGGADLVVLLDVDCLAAPRLLARYAEAAVERPQALLCGPVAYLPPLPPGRREYSTDELRAATPHPARPAPPDGTLVPMDDPRLFWSLSFAVDRTAWRRVGGFDEGYVGYGGEDTDFGQRAREAGVPGWWVGGAEAHHQWHPVSDPPVEHLEDVVRNANRFRQRWGWFPMEGWLAAFADAGLARRVGDVRWEVVRPARRARA